MPFRLRWIALAASIIAGGIVAARVTRKDETAVTMPVLEGSAEPTTLVPWCAPGLEPIAGGGCFAAPPSSSPRPAPLLVYLHGRFEHGAPQEELDRQHRLAQSANAQGYAVLALRGREGQCLQPELAAWVCWPASERSVDAGPSYVSAWTPAFEEAEKRVGKGKRFVLGFSSGAFFAVILATRALIEADAFAIAGGGPIEPTRAEGTKVPLLLVSGDDDPSQPGMIQLEDELVREAWPHDSFTRAGGHELTDADIQASLAFFTRAPKEPLPLKPPLTTHVARARMAPAPDAAAEPAVFAASPTDPAAPRPEAIEPETPSADE